MKLSVIIPTYNRKAILLKCLKSLIYQTCLPHEYEIIIVNDGSTDGTKQAIAQISSEADVVIRYFEQGNGGPSAARNLAIKNCSGEIVFITGDDIIATPKLLQEHVEWHELYPGDNVAILGYCTWSPEIKVTPFMKWLEHGGPMLAYHLIKGDEANFWHFYTGNISIKRAYLGKYGGFDEGFPYAAYEDIELGYRLEKCGLQIKYNKNAVGYHYHPGVTIDSFRRRMSKAGASAAILVRKHPELESEFKKYYHKATSHIKIRHGRLWTFLYETVHDFGLTRLSKRISWRAKRHYTRQMAEAFLEGYSMVQSQDSS